MSNSGPILEQNLSVLKAKFSGPFSEKHLNIIKDKFSGPSIETTLNEIKDKFSGPVIEALLEPSEGNVLELSTLADVNGIFIRSAQSTIQITAPATGNVPTLIIVDADSTLEITLETTRTREIYVLGCNIVNLNTENALSKLVNASTNIQFDVSTSKSIIRSINATNTLVVTGTSNVGFTVFDLNAESNLNLASISQFFQILEVGAMTGLALGNQGYNSTKKGLFGNAKRVSIRNISKQTLPIRSTSTGDVLRVPPGDVIMMNVSELDVDQIARFRHQFFIVVDP